MPNDLRFIDPVFASEVVLRGHAMQLYTAARPQFERLRNIRHLGVIGHLTDTAIHTRHHHVVGLLRVFDKLCRQPPSEGLPKSFLWSYWCRLCFGQTGHAAFAYDGEKAVLLACQIDQVFRDEFFRFLSPVVRELKPCTICRKRSDCR